MYTIVRSETDKLVEMGSLLSAQMLLPRLKAHAANNLTAQTPPIRAMLQAAVARCMVTRILEIKI